MTKNIFLPLEVHEAGLAWDAPSEAQYDLALVGGKLPPINTVNVCKIYIASTSVGPSFFFLFCTFSIKQNRLERARGEVADLERNVKRPLFPDINLWSGTFDTTYASVA